MKILVPAVDPAWTSKPLITHFLNCHGSWCSAFKQTKIGNNLPSTICSKLQQLRTWLWSGSGICASKAGGTVGTASSAKTMTKKQGWLKWNNLKFLVSAVQGEQQRGGMPHGQAANPVSTDVSHCLVTSGHTTVPSKDSNYKAREHNIRHNVENMVHKPQSSQLILLGQSCLLKLLGK